MVHRGRKSRSKKSKAAVSANSTGVLKKPIGADEETWNRICALDRALIEAADLVSVESWGLSDDVKDQLKQHKHNTVDRKLSFTCERSEKTETESLCDALYYYVLCTVKRLSDSQRKIIEKEHLGQEQRMSFGKRDKQRIAVSQTNQPRTINQVFDWLKDHGTTDNQPITTKSATLKRSKSKDDKNKVLNAPKPANRAEALKRLQDKIQELKIKRKADKTLADVEEKRKLKRRSSKMKMRERKKLEKQSLNPSANESPRKKSNENNPSAASASLSDDSQPPLSKKVQEATPSSTKKIGQPLVGAAKATPPSSKGPIGKVQEQQVKNDRGAVVFSKFDFAESAAERSARMSVQEKAEFKKSRKKENKRKGDKLSGRDYGRLLKKVESRQEKLQKLKETDVEKAKKLQENIAWSAALQRAQGDKVKDNPELLRKSLKKREHKKQHSQKKWEQRKEQVQKKQTQKQDKRNKNIKDRKEQKRGKKLEKARKRGRNV